MSMCTTNMGTTDKKPVSDFRIKRGNICRIKKVRPDVFGSIPGCTCIRAPKCEPARRVRRMCWGLRVFAKVFGNLAGRVCREMLDAVYKMCTTCSRARNADHKLDTKEELEDFYQNVSREEAEYLLEHLQNGTFVIRPSNATNSLGTMSIIQDEKTFHLNVRRREDGFIALGVEKENEKSFRGLSHLINYYVSNCLVLYSNGVQCNALLIPYVKINK